MASKSLILYSRLSSSGGRLRIDNRSQEITRVKRKNKCSIQKSVKDEDSPNLPPLEGPNGPIVGSAPPLFDPGQHRLIISVHSATETPEPAAQVHVPLGRLPQVAWAVLPSPRDRRAPGSLQVEGDWTASTRGLPRE